MSNSFFPAEFTDQMNRKIRLESKPLRIVSLVPSQTELLHALGLDDEVAGITRFCIHPESWFRNKRRVGGTKDVNFDRIREINPDLIIGNKEENEREQIETLANAYTVWMSDIHDIREATNMIREIGILCSKAEEAEKIAGEIRNRYELFLQKPRKKYRVAYFIWRKPFMCAGSGTFINHLMQCCGFENVFADAEGRYPEVSPEMIRDSSAELILLSSEPYPFAEKHLNEFREMIPGAQVLTVDGEMFSWYGSRLLEAFSYFESLLASIEKEEGRNA